MHNTFKLLSLTLFIVFIFFGCTPPNAFSFFKEDELKAKAFQYTKTVNLKNKGEILAVINATYLNSVDSEFDDENQNFLIGLFFSNTDNNESLKLGDDKYYMTMNDNNATYISELTEEDKMYNHIPIYNKWATYQMIKFDTNESETNLSLRLYYKKNIDSNESKKSNPNVLFDTRPVDNYLKSPNINFEAE